ncbi:hypothetical protein KIW84_031921 [Lathyrus oleraceus]|uniref:Uncharacterized protein n=1 Tax=Pisum sativum TaxID=3888 RepID=A0A9D4XX89_PEA|nr:hypothetical protein KIW84_031921 [Pisum sativum]
MWAQYIAGSAKFPGVRIRGISRSVGVEKGDMPHVRCPTPRDYVSHQVFSPTVRTAVDFRSNSFDDRNDFPIVEKNQVLNTNFNSPLSRSSSGAVSNVLASPNHHFMSPTSSTRKLLRILTNNAPIAKGPLAAKVVELLFLLLARHDLAPDGQHTIEPLIPLFDSPISVVQQLADDLLSHLLLEEHFQKDPVTPKKKLDYLVSSRPTAVNLSDATTKLKEIILKAAATTSEARDGNCSKQLLEEVVSGVNAGETLGIKISSVAGLEVEAIDKLLHISVEVDVNGDHSAERSGVDRLTNQNSPTVHRQSDSARGTYDDVLLSRGVDNPEDFNEREHGKNSDISAENYANEDKMLRTECEHVVLAMPAKSGLCSSATDFAAERVEENSDIKEVHDEDAGQELHKASSSFHSQEMDKQLDSKGSKLNAIGAEEAEECTSTTTDASSMSTIVAMSDADAKVEFDLNEGFGADEGKRGELNNIATSGSAPSV